MVLPSHDFDVLVESGGCTSDKELFADPVCACTGTVPVVVPSVPPIHGVLVAVSGDHVSAEQRSVHAHLAMFQTAEDSQNPYFESVSF